MISSVQSAGKNSPPKRSIIIGKRLLWILLIWSIQLIYIPTSERIAGGIEPKLPIDVFPIWPVWVVPYVLCYLLWFAGFAWAVLSVNDRQFRSFVVAFLVTCSISVAIFMIYPTYVRPFEVPGNDAFSSLLRFFHESTGRYNALPSGHIYISALLVFFYSLWYPRYKSIWTFLLVIISLSTLFTAQHYVLDILGGLMVAMLGYYIGLRWTGISFRMPHAKRKNITLPPSESVAD